MIHCKSTAQTLCAWACAAAIVIALILRFLSLQFMEFKGDEFNAYALAAAYLQHMAVPQVGLVSSTGLYNPPFFITLLWPPLLFSRDPVIVTAWIVLLNAIGIVGLLLFLRRIAGDAVAFPVAALIATSPWLFILSRKIWAQDALFPFLILLHWLLMRYASERRPWQIWATGVVVALLTQLHMSAWVLPAAISVWFLLLRVWPKWRDIGIAAAAFIVLYIPYIAFHIADNFQNLSGTTTQHPGSIIDQLRWLVGINGSGGLWYMWGAVPPPAIPSWLLLAANVSTVIIAALATIGFTIVTIRLLRDSHSLRSPENITEIDRYVLLLTLFVVVSLAVFLVMGIPALPHYHLVFLPLVALLMVIAVTSASSWAQWLASGLILVIISVFIGLIMSIRSVIVDHPEQLKGDYGTPYHYSKEHWGPYIQAVQQGKMRLPGR